jgi:hypothetical protein
MARAVNGMARAGHIAKNLRRFAGVSEAEARSRNPERSEGTEADINEGSGAPGDSNLRRIAGVSEAGACIRNPERKRGSNQFVRAIDDLA